MSSERTAACTGFGDCGCDVCCPEPGPSSAAKTELDLLATTDAQVWAREFVRLHGGDEELMLGWFANAIETGREAGRKLISIPTEEDDDDLNLRY